MQTSDTINELATALAKAQGAIKNPGKNREVSVRMKTGGTYKFKYATFDGIIDAIRKPLADNGLWFIQTISDREMVTRITHSSGQWMDCSLPMPVLQGDPQQIGSLITYFKRYGLCAAFGIAADEDDDANTAQGNSVEFQDHGNERDADRITAQQRTEIEALVAEVGADVRRFCTYLKVKSIADIPADRFDEAIAGLEAKRTKAAA